VVSSPLLKRLFSHISFNGRYRGFTVGVVSLSDVLFFLSVAVFFLCLTVGVLERRRFG
jgi:ABC-2 type transport system permease protein